MSRLLLTLVLAALPWVTWAAPVCVDPEQPERSHPARDGNGGIGGTGSPLDRPAASSRNDPDTSGGGIGGTGSPANGGIGGTGAPLAQESAVGIVGVISGFASVCVNGVEVHFDSATPVDDNGDPSSSDKLAVGNVVSIEATHSAKGLQAKTITVLHALEGPITKVSRGGKTIEVLGKAVHIGPDTRTATPVLAPGQLVKVSALTGADGQLFATRIQSAPDLKSAVTLGNVMQSGKDVLVNGVPVNAQLSTPSALVKGNWNGKELIASRILPDPTYRFAEKIDRLLLEGLVQTTDGRGKFRAAGIEFTLPGNNTRLTAPSQNQRVFVDAATGANGKMTVRRIELPNSARDPVDATGVPATRPAIQGEMPPKPEVQKKSDTAEPRRQAERAEKTERSEKAERTEKTERAEKTERTEKPERTEKMERVARIERPEKNERPERYERH